MFFSAVKYDKLIIKVTNIIINDRWGVALSNYECNIIRFPVTNGKHASMH